MPPRKKRRSKKLKKTFNKNIPTPTVTPPSQINKHGQTCNVNDIASLEDNQTTEINIPIYQIDGKQPMVAPNGKIFYPCQYCSKIFPREATCKTHMVKCLNISKTQLNHNLNVTNVIENVPEVVVNRDSDKTNQSMIAPNGKTFYPCQYCSKIFPREITFKSHMEKCSKKNSSKVDIEESVSKDLNNSGSSIENIDPAPPSASTIHIEPNDHPDDSVIEKNIDDPVSKKAKYDLSIYDYDEEDSPDESRINADTKCKVCPFIAENPIDLLRHKREVHKVQRKILPPHEIQKYFDYPDRTFCPICEQPIKSRNFRSIFVKHLLVHTAGLTYECRICKKKFRRIDHMRTHEKRHVLTFAELQAIQDSVNNTPVDNLPFILSN